MKRAFYGVSHWHAGILCAAAVVFAAVVLWNLMPGKRAVQDAPTLKSTDLIVLPAPGNPHRDGVTYGDGPYALPDVFSYTGKGAPNLPAPKGLYWTSRETDGQRLYFASLSNWDDYEDKDMFNAYVYDENSEYIMNNILSKEFIFDKGWPGVKVRQEFVGEPGKTYRFAIQVLSSRQMNTNPLRPWNPARRRRI